MSSLLRACRLHPRSPSAGQIRSSHGSLKRSSKGLGFAVPSLRGSQGTGVVIGGTPPRSVRRAIGHSENRYLGLEMEAAMQNGAPADSSSNQKQSPKLLTLVIIRKDDSVLLGMKKRGFGAGYFNGFGGKVEANETIDEAAMRELQEESGVVALSMERQGILTFHFDGNPQPWEVHVYNVGDYAGEPCETEEMAPQWFRVSEIPYESMWQDDPIWYPEFLQGSYFKGDFYFHSTHTLVSHTLHVLEKLDA